MDDEATRRKIPRRGVIAAGAATLTVGAIGGLMLRRRIPAERSVSFGFEDVARKDLRWDGYRAALNAADVNAVSVSVGRTDWTAFPWETRPSAAPSLVGESGRDYVAEALAEIGENRSVTLIIDTLAPALIEQEPRLAGVSPEGEASDLFAGVSALESGKAGDHIVDLARTISDRYAPDRIALTELMFDEHTFGSADLSSYREHSGSTDWPRLPDGGIDTADPSLGQWRSDALATLLARVREVTAPRGVALDMDVRAPWSDPAGDRSGSGHDYAVLLEQADRLVVWNYFAINDRPPEYGAEITRSLQERFPGRFVMSTGLWASSGIISLSAMRGSLEAVADAGADSVSVTPASKMTDQHWQALERAWA